MSHYARVRRRLSTVTRTFNLLGLMSLPVPRRESLVLRLGRPFSWSKLVYNLTLPIFLSARSINIETCLTVLDKYMVPKDLVACTVGLVLQWCARVVEAPFSCPPTSSQSDV